MLGALLRRAARARYLHVLGDSLVAPTGAPAALSGQRAAYRVLVLGTGVVSGRGVATYGLAFLGALQRSLSAALDVPVDVELVRQHGAGIEQASAIAAPRLGEDWDAYVLAFGVNDALLLTPRAIWSRAMQLLLSTIEDRRPSPFIAPVVVAGIPPLGSFRAHRGLLMPYFVRHADRLNGATRRLVQQHGEAVFTPLPGMTDDTARPFGSPAAYATWAERVARDLAPRLRHRAARADGRAWSSDASPTVRRVLRSSARRRALSQVAREAAALLDADYAVVRLLDGDELCGVADSFGGGARSVRCDATPCSLVLAGDAVRVAGAGTDARTALLPMVPSYGIHDYAGAPLRDAAGRVAGVLGVYNGRAADPAELEAVQRLAERAAALVDDDVPEAAAAAPAAAPDAASAGHDGDASAPPSLLRRLAISLRGSVRLRREGMRLIESAQRTVQPVDRSVRVVGPRPVRLLVLGGGYGVGFGVEDRALALDGCLARSIHRRTGRGVEVTNRAAPTATLGVLRSSMPASGAAGFDVVLWTPVFEEAAASIRRTGWARHLGDLVREVQASSDAAVVLMAFPALLGHQPLAVLARARARRVNRLLARIAARWPRTVVAEPAPVPLGGIARIDGHSVYRAAGVHMIDAVLEALASVPVRAAAPAVEPVPILR